jgi:hypothetical protein
MMNRNLDIRSVFIACVLVALCIGSPGASAREPVTRFVYVGCNRVSFGVKDPAPSTANVAQLKQTFADIAALPVKPKYFFFVGDLVLGMLADEGKTLTEELDAWMALLDESRFADSGIELLPIAGNHEADASAELNSGDYIEYPDADNLAAWVDWLETNHFAKAGNGPSGKAELERDLLAEDNNQTQTYSFDDPDAGVHYILLNTDSLSTVPSPLLPDKTVASWAPYHWVEKDIARASMDSRIDKIVVLAHKPLVLENPGPHDIVYNTAPHTLGDALLELFGNTPKFAGYFCAHAHKWLYTDKLGPEGNVTQVIAGNGGSELQNDWSPAGGTYFGFTLVNLYDDNTIGVVSYNRPAPTPYNASGPQPAATPAAEKFFSVIGKEGGKDADLRQQLKEEKGS